MIAIDIDGNIKTFSTTPKSWNNVLGGFDKFSKSELEEFGFYDVEPIKTTFSDFNERIHNIGSLSFDSDNNVFKYSRSNKSFSKSISELKSDKISNLKEVYNHKLSKTDWIIIRDKELENTTEQSVLDARAALRTECDTKEAEINALSTKVNVVKYILPNTL